MMIFVNLSTLKSLHRQFSLTYPRLSIKYGTVLFCKLSVLGIRGQLLDWFRDYLKDGQQAGVLKGSELDHLSLSGWSPPRFCTGASIVLTFC